MFILNKNELSPLAQPPAKKKGKFRKNFFPGIALIFCLTGFVFSFFLPVIGIIICIVGLIFALAVKSGDYRLDKFGILFSLIGLFIGLVVGMIQLFMLSVPFLLPALKVIAAVAGLFKTISGFFGAA